jgi:SAM-dependent methyltransferase
MSLQKVPGSVAFGVEEGMAPYSLRQARYDALAEDVAKLAAARHAATGQRTALLDVGVYNGVSRRYLEVRPGAEHIDYSGVDIFPAGEGLVYKSREWKLHHINLESGMGELPSDSYDVVLCEQVCEHLLHPEHALADIARVLRPGGTAFIGVPIFPPGIHLIRKHLVPMADRVTGAQRGHVQAWSLYSFLDLLRKSCPSLAVSCSRGFRFVSGGPLRFLEYHRWWWQLNRWLGSVIPALCTEVQVVLTKPAASVADSPARALAKAA